MKLHELNLTPAKNRKRVGRGIAAGQGKTAGRGTKGQGARSGGNLRATFEGGQNALIYRLPKLRGFSSKRPSVQLIHTDQLNQFSGTVTRRELLAAGLISKTNLPVRLVNRGELKKKLIIEVTGASKPATVAVAKAGGQVKIVTVKVKGAAKPAKEAS